MSYKRSRYHRSLVAEILLKEVEEAEFDPVGPSRSQRQEAATK